MGCFWVTTTQKTVKEPSRIKLLVLLIMVLIAAVSIIQGAFLSGIMAAIWVLILYYFATWMKQGEERRSRQDLMDQRLIELEKRVRQIEEREHN